VLLPQQAVVANVEVVKILEAARIQVAGRTRVAAKIRVVAKIQVVDLNLVHRKLIVRTHARILIWAARAAIPLRG
jgi:hypothetical protein